ncbi:hypothetical protein DFH07DRAFT_1056695 [Mycena maculata]|uniref:Uncharacterized protein n=1 Tax=Mycena maculata TaxID=230809 RepID=A0AAD7K2P2_9AGAR|nr:hypothetical protein DFH07DRAFT_1056695 [Mycena maculata]
MSRRATLRGRSPSDPHVTLEHHLDQAHQAALATLARANEQAREILELKAEKVELQAEIDELKAENTELREENGQMHVEVATSGRERRDLANQVTALQKRLAKEKQARWDAAVHTKDSTLYERLGAETRAREQADRSAEQWKLSCEATRALADARTQALRAAEETLRVERAKAVKDAAKHKHLQALIHSVADEIRRDTRGTQDLAASCTEVSQSSSSSSINDLPTVSQLEQGVGNSETLPTYTLPPAQETAASGPPSDEHFHLAKSDPLFGSKTYTRASIDAGPATSGGSSASDARAPDTGSRSGKARPPQNASPTPMEGTLAATAKLAAVVDELVSYAKAGVIPSSLQRLSGPTETSKRELSTSLGFPTTRSAVAPVAPVAPVASASRSPAANGKPQCGASISAAQSVHHWQCQGGVIPSDAAAVIWGSPHESGRSDQV